MLAADASRYPDHIKLAGLEKVVVKRGYTAKGNTSVDTFKPYINTQGV